jgi:hypothetical protein
MAVIVAAMPELLYPTLCKVCPTRLIIRCGPLLQPSPSTAAEAAGLSDGCGPARKYSWLRNPHFAKFGLAHLTAHQPEKRMPQGIRPRRERIDRLLTSY